MNRRRFIEAGTAVWAGAVTGSSCLRPPSNEALEPVKDLAAKLFNSLDDFMKKEVCVDYDHPLRQYHNRGVSLGGAKISYRNFTWDQLELLNRLFYSGLSEEGRHIVPRQYFVRFFGVRTLKIIIAGDPNTPYYQVIFSGPHMNLRLGGKNKEGVAFGGPIIYGDQRGDYIQGLPNNVYQYQFHQGHALFSRLSSSQKQRALLEQAPIQTRIELQGEKGVFPGLPVKDLSPESRQKIHDLIRDILKTYNPDDVAYAWDCLEQNGGIDALHLSFYKDGEVEKSGRYQIFRLEGPAAVLYFRGFPHVHAFVNVARDGNNPLSVGEEVGENPTVLEGAALKVFFETVMKGAAGTAFAYYAPESAVGLLRTGVIRTGDIYNLESWGNRISVVTIKGSQLTGKAAQDLARSGVNLQSDKTYAIATTNNLADEELVEAFGRGKARSVGARLRDATIEHSKKNGFPG